MSRQERQLAAGSIRQRLFTVEGLGKCSGQRGFADLSRSGDQVGMPDAAVLNRLRKQLDRPIMPHNFIPSGHGGIVNRMCFFSQQAEACIQEMGMGRFESGRIKACRASWRPRQIRLLLRLNTGS